MTTIYNNLKIKLFENNISRNRLKDELELSGDTLDRKLQGLLPWDIVDVVRICNLVHSTDVDFLFVQLDGNTI